MCIRDRSCTGIVIGYCRCRSNWCPLWRQNIRSCAFGGGTVLNTRSSCSHCTCCAIVACWSQRCCMIICCRYLSISTCHSWDACLMCRLHLTIVDNACRCSVNCRERKSRCCRCCCGGDRWSGRIRSHCITWNWRCGGRLRYSPCIFIYVCRSRGSFSGGARCRWCNI